MKLDVLVQAASPIANTKFEINRSICSFF